MTPHTVIQVFHPQLKNSRTNRRWAEAAMDEGFQVRDLYTLYPDGNIDIAVEQPVCENADILVFQHPMHWYSAPWLLKKWIDTVLTYGWAYGGPDKLAGKRWRQAISIGAGSEEYTSTGSRRYTAPELLHPFERTAAFCQMEFDTFLRYGSGYTTDNEITEWTTDYLRWLRT